MSEHESFRLAQEVCVAGEKEYSFQLSHLPREIWMSKLLIRKCIFCISVKMFNDEKCFTSSSSKVDNLVYTSSLQTVPLTFRIVYTLFHRIGFSKEEIAEILNITSVQVNDRLAKATKKLR